VMLENILELPLSNYILTNEQRIRY
jgi:hypothetical protein